MGVIKAAAGAIGGTLADQWKEFYYSDALPNDILMVRALKRVSENSSNTKGSDDYVSDGSVIALADGQCGIVTDMGKVVCVCTEPGENVISRNGSGVKAFFREAWDRVGYGGDVHHLQRVYIINTKEITGNYFAVEHPLAVRITDSNIGADIDCSVTFSGVYSFRITDPEKFYHVGAGGMCSECRLSRFSGQIRNEFIASMSAALAKVAVDGLRPSQLPAHVDELNRNVGSAMTDRLSRFGITICSVAIDSLKLTPMDSAMMSGMQFTGMLRDPEMAAAYLLAAKAEAMVVGSANPAGGVIGLAAVSAAAAAGDAARDNPLLKSSGGWLCSCGTLNRSGTFCTECGKKRSDPFAKS